MHTRSKAAATALLLTASVTGLAATSGSAQAIGSHPASHARAAATLTVNVQSTKNGPVLDTTTIAPGNTVFSFTRAGAGGGIEILRLKAGYSINQAGQDFGKLFSGDVKAIRRIDKNVVFYGGAATVKGAASQIGMKLDKTGTYYAVNIDKNTLSTFQVEGAAESRSLPKADGHINMLKGNSFSHPSGLPAKGWLKQTNHATEPHFMDFQQVKGSTTRKQVKKYFDHGAKGTPSFGLPGQAGTLIVSPGHTIVWPYDLTRGKYVTACFWPSKKTGMPHALMGMWDLVHLG
jgi:hypothetical protein